MKNTVQTEILREEDFSDWTKFVCESSSGSIYSTPEYLDILCGATGGSFRILAAVKGEQIMGGIALYETPSRAGTYVSNRLLLYYNGIVLRDVKTKHPYKTTSRNLEVMSSLLRYLANSTYSRIILHNRSPIHDVRPFQSDGWIAWPSYTYVVGIDDIELLRSRMEQNLRRLVRRCEDADVVLTEDDDFDSFFELHQQIHNRKNVPLYLPYERYKEYFIRLRSAGLCRLYHARLGGKSIAAQLVLANEHPVTHTVCAGADPGFLKLGSTPFLRWKVFENLSQIGYIANDLTDAAIGDVTRFKAQLGGDLIMNTVLKRTDSIAFRSVGQLTYLKARAKGAFRRLVGLFGQGGAVG